jgi:hypothetical protein
MGKMRNAQRVLVGKAEGKGQLERRRRRWENIKINFKERGRYGVHWNA